MGIRLASSITRVHLILIRKEANMRRVLLTSVLTVCAWFALSSHAWAQYWYRSGWARSPYGYYYHQYPAYNYSYFYNGYHAYGSTPYVVPYANPSPYPTYYYYQGPYTYYYQAPYANGLYPYTYQYGTYYAPY
jgi:hypothetical protein